MPTTCDENLPTTTLIITTTLITSTTMLTTTTGEGMSPDKTQWGEQFEGTLQPPTLSRLDEEFQKQGLEFVEVKEGISLVELNDLFERVSGLVQVGRVVCRGNQCGIQNSLCASA